MMSSYESTTMSPSVLMAMLAQPKTCWRLASVLMTCTITPLQKNGTRNPYPGCASRLHPSDGRAYGLSRNYHYTGGVSTIFSLYGHLRINLHHHGANGRRPVLHLDADGHGSHVPCGVEHLAHLGQLQGHRFLDVGRACPRARLVCWDKGGR